MSAASAARSPRDAGTRVGRAVDEHDRPDAAAERAQVVVGHARRAEDQPVGAAAGLDREDALLVDRLRGVGDEHVIAVGRRGPAQPAEDRLERRVAEVGHDDRDGLRAPEHEAAREGARGVVQLGRGVRTRSASAGSTVVLPFRTRETVDSDTPACLATSEIVAASRRDEPRHPSVDQHDPPRILRHTIQKAFYGRGADVGIRSRPHREACATPGRA